MQLKKNKVVKFYGQREKTLKWTLIGNQLDYFASKVFGILCQHLAAILC